MSKDDPFEFLENVARYQLDQNALARLNRRHKLLVEPFRESIEDKRVLSLGAFDGRWAYVFSQAGAASVVGIGSHKATAELFADFPKNEISRRVKIEVGDIQTEVRRLVKQGASFDICALFGTFDRIMGHFDLLQNLKILQSQLIIIDGDFVQSDEKLIELCSEPTDSELSPIGSVNRADQDIFGIPTIGAMEAMASELGYSMEWLDVSACFGDDRTNVSDYFNGGQRKRMACFLKKMG